MLTIILRSEIPTMPLWTVAESVVVLVVVSALIVIGYVSVRKRQEQSGIHTEGPIRFHNRTTSLRVIDRAASCWQAGSEQASTRRPY